MLVGVLGLALALIEAIDPLVTLAHVVHFIVENWHVITRAIWSSVLKIFGVELTPLTQALLNAGSFLLLLELAATKSTVKENASGPEGFGAMVRQLLLQVLNFCLLVLIFALIVTSTIQKSGVGVGTLKGIPMPYELGNWRDSQNWAPMIIWIFSGSGILACFQVRPIPLLRKLFDVAFVVVGILGINFALEGFIELYGWAKELH